MPNEKRTLDYDALATAPVNELMQLPIAELDGFIQQADRVASNAKAMKDWLTWIKAEKILREDTLGVES